MGTTHAIAAAERFWRGTGYNTQPVDDERSRVLVAAQRTLDRYAFDNAHRAMRSRYGLMVELLPDAAGVIRQSSRVRGRNPKAHALAHPRITERVATTVARLAIGSGGSPSGRAGFAPAG